MYVHLKGIYRDNKSLNSNFIPTDLIKRHCKSLFKYNLQLVYKLLTEIGKISTVLCCTFLFVIPKYIECDV